MGFYFFFVVLRVVCSIGWLLLPTFCRFNLLPRLFSALTKSRTLPPAVVCLAHQPRLASNVFLLMEVMTKPQLIPEEWRATVQILVGKCRLFGQDLPCPILSFLVGCLLSADGNDRHQGRRSDFDSEHVVYFEVLHIV